MFCSEKEFLPVTEKTIHSGNIENVTTKEKSKFPQEFFPEVNIVFKNIFIFDLYHLHCIYFIFSANGRVKGS